MRTRARAFWNAFPSAMLVTVLVAVFCVLCGYLLTGWVEGILEALGALPRGWGSAHEGLLVLIGVVEAMPLIAWAGVRYFRMAISAEAELLERGLA